MHTVFCRLLLTLIAALPLVVQAAAKPSASSQSTPIKRKLTIITAHRKSVPQEFTPLFIADHKERYGEDVELVIVDQGGASDALKFIFNLVDKKPKDLNLDKDVYPSMPQLFWGGGEHPHYELEKRNLLSSHQLSDALKKEVPPTLAGVTLYNKDENWHASAMSSFGIFYNKTLLKVLKLPEPQTWEDLADPKYFGYLSNADLRRSSSNVTMSFVILQALGWEKGWELLTAMAGNTRSFTHSSTDPIKAVVSGDAAAGLTIGYYANAKIGDLGEGKVGYALPAGKTIINPDPISILKGAPDRVVAERFIDFLLSAKAQKLLLLPKGAVGGPKFSTLGRIAVNSQAYEEVGKNHVDALNPFALTFKPMLLDVKKVTELQFVFTDLLAATHIDTHKALKEAWEGVIKRGSKPEEVAALAKPPVTEQEILTLSKRWNDNVFRNATINEWVRFAKEKYAKLAKSS